MVSLFDPMLSSDAIELVIEGFRLLALNGRRVLSTRLDIIGKRMYHNKIR